MIRPEIVHPIRITESRIIQACIDRNIEVEFHGFIVEDVCRIVNDGFRYPPRPRRGGLSMARIPDDYSISIARHFGVEPYMI